MSLAFDWKWASLLDRERKENFPFAMSFHENFPAKAELKALQLRREPQESDEKLF